VGQDRDVFDEKCMIEKVERGTLSPETKSINSNQSDPKDFNLMHHKNSQNDGEKIGAECSQATSRSDKNLGCLAVKCLVEYLRDSNRRCVDVE